MAKNSRKASPPDGAVVNTAEEAAIKEADASAIASGTGSSTPDVPIAAMEAAETKVRAAAKADQARMAQLTEERDALRKTLMEIGTMVREGQERFDRVMSSLSELDTKIENITGQPVTPKVERQVTLHEANLKQREYERERSGRVNRMVEQAGRAFRGIVGNSGGSHMARRTQKPVRG